MANPESYPDALRVKEDALIRIRRGREENAPIGDRVGLALSGGGIRSATFCLGVLQALAEKDVLPKIDFLSTISGGSYTGAFLGRLYSRSGDSNATTAVKAVLTDTHSAELRWLRESGRYLAPTGSGDVMLGTAVTLRNWASLNVAIMCFFVPLFWVLAALHRRVGDPASLAANWVWAGAGCFFAVALLAGFLYWFAPLGASGYRLARRRRRLSAVLTWSLVGTAVIAAIAAIDTAAARGYSWFLAQQDLWIAISLPFATLLTLGGAVATRIRGLIALLPKQATTSRIPIAAIAGIAGTGLFLLVLWFYAMIAYFIAYGAVQPVDFGAQAAINSVDVALTEANLIQVVAAEEATGKAIGEHMAACATILHYLRCGLFSFFVVMLAYLALWNAIRGQVPFVNSSAMLPLYCARLVRAYLGASNLFRLPEHNRSGIAVTEPIRGDDIDYMDYKPHRARGPLHIIGLTFNETIGGRTQIETHDRKGMSLAIGPAGMSASTKHHALWETRKNEIRHDRCCLDPRILIPWIQIKLNLFREAIVELKPVHRKCEDAFRIFEDRRFHGGKICEKVSILPEPLTLGHWVGISGAAVSTGMGANTTPGLSFLTGLFNLRMGYWWDSGIAPELRDSMRVRGGSVREFLGRLNDRLFPAHAQLLAEFFGRFHGPAKRHWYLSDGGHFENTGAYELIRRRVEFIVVCDNGADPDYAFADVGNLVRKVRTDFKAEISFLTRGQLDDTVAASARRYFGTLDDLRRGRWSEEAYPNGSAGMDKTGTGAARHTIEQNRNRYSSCYAALAQVTYDNGAVGTLLLVKPSLMGDEAADLLEYHRGHPDFPQQSTLDQFFDEAQWESYRKLGEHIATRLFSMKATDTASEKPASKGKNRAKTEGKRAGKDDWDIGEIPSWRPIELTPIKPQRP